VDELVRMINVQRSFEATQRALTSLGRIGQSFANVMMR
jgi:flagellar basal body rod protein FlgG